MGVAFAGAAQATPPPYHYAALGDSYSAGVGTGSYDPDSGACKRSDLAHPALWANSRVVESFTFAACSGATTQDVLDTQIAQLPAYADLVTISIGGNDAGFSRVVGACLLGTDQDCVGAVESSKQFVRTELPARLDETYQAISDAAPAARVFVPGYPRLFELNACEGGLSLAKRTVLNEAADLLDEVIADRVAAAGFTFVDVRAAFAGHGVCSADPWINALVQPQDDAFHPTAAGQRNGYFAPLSLAMY
ncbi:SGNH/GDSL hydrolase family protein [Goodfellowiella coeruleoviolacea]|nr:SGNH/GDSL hydrolase family protein [Goodfellowiella coeruleoviolacea]